jgi:hypothetical protein
LEIAKRKEADPLGFYLNSMRNVINIVVLGAPWTILGGSAIGWNLVINSIFNQLWAEGNIWLILNTCFGVSQYILSLLLVFEADFFIRYLKFIRIISLISGYLYNIVYILGIIKFLDVLNDWDGEKIEFS